MTRPIGIRSTPIPRKSRARRTYIRPEADEDLAPRPAAPEAERRRRRPGRPATPNERARGGPRGEHIAAGRAGSDQGARARLDRRAEEVGRARAEDAAGRNGVARARQPSDQVIGSVQWVFRFGPVGPLKKAPGARPSGPRRRSTGARRSPPRLARDREDVRVELDVRPARVVAADALLGGAADVERRVEEVRVRAGGRVDDRTPAVDELELVVVPVGALGALVLAVADGDRILAERLGRVVGVEEELDHLPVALVQVVPVVVGVEEPVLQRQLAGRPGRSRRGRTRPAGPSRAAGPRARSRSPGRARCRGSRGGTRRGRRGRRPSGRPSRDRRGSTARAARP